jgi:hypothetical protein
MSYLSAFALLVRFFRHCVRPTRLDLRRKSSPLTLEGLERRDVPSAPVAWGDTYQLIHENVLAVPAASGLLAHGSDPDGNPLTAIVTTDPGHGSVATYPDGSFVYVPDLGYVGADSFGFVLSDGAASSSEATMSITVTNSTPTASGDSFQVTHDRALVVSAAFGLLAHGSDADGDALSAVVTTGPAHGTVAVQDDGGFVYEPAAGYVGPDSFRFALNDSVASSTEATMSITVTNAVPNPGAPSYVAPAGGTLIVQATDDGGSSTPPGGNTLSVHIRAGLLAGASDADRDLLTAALAASGAPAHRTVSVSTDGSFVYTPQPGSVGRDSFEYAVTDGVATNVGTAQINVEPVSLAAQSATYAVTHDQTLTVTAQNGLLDDASSSNGHPLNVVLVTAPSNGTLTVAADGSFSYTPAVHFVGTDSFTYRVSDGTTTSNVATITIDVTDTAPVAWGDTLILTHDQTLTEDSWSGLLADAYDNDGDALTATVTAGPSHGTLTTSADGSFVYSPAAGYVGDDVFRFTVSDGVATSNEATVTISVVNAAPVTETTLSYTATAGSTLTVDASAGLLAGAYDPDGDPLTVSLAADGAPAHGSVTVSADGSFVYTPQAGYVGFDSFQYTVGDGLTSTVGTAEINVGSNRFG